MRSSVAEKRLRLSHRCALYSAALAVVACAQTEESSSVAEETRVEKTQEAARYLPVDQGTAEPGLRFNLPESIDLSSDGSLVFEIANESQRDAQLRVHAYVRTELGSQRLLDVAQLSLAAAGRSQLRIDARALQLPASITRTGVLNLGAEVHFGERRVDQISAPLYFEPNDRGWQLHASAPTLYAALPANARPALGYAMSEQQRAQLLESDHRGTTPVSHSTLNQARSTYAAARLAPVTTRFCFMVDSFFDDAAVGDFMNAAGVVSRPATGMVFRIFDPNGAELNGFLDDAAGANEGCTRTDITLESDVDYTFVLESIASAGGTMFQVQDDRINNTTEALAITQRFTQPLGATTLIAFGVGSFETPINATLGLAFALSRAPGRVPLNQPFGDNALPIRLRGADGAAFNCNTTGETGLIHFDNRVFNNVAMPRLKFLLAHELGHAMFAASTNNTANNCAGLAYDPSDTGDGGDALCSTRNEAEPTHGLLTREWSSSAANEGFADVYAAALFNDRGQADCQFGQLGGVLDCQGDASAAEGFMVELCNPPSGINVWTRDRGAEFDWLRMYWDMYTATGGPDINQLLEWIDQANDTEPFDRGNYYKLLDARAQASSNAGLRTAWNLHKYRNGVNSAPQVALRAVSSQNLVTTDVAAAGDNAGALRANITTNMVGANERFELFSDDPGQRTTVTLRALGYGPGNEKLVTAEVDRQQPLVRASSASSIGPWERFRIVYDENARASFQADNGRWLSAEASGEMRLLAWAAEPTDTEKFEIFVMQ